MSLGGVGGAIATVFSFTILGLLLGGKKQKSTTQRIGELNEQTAKEGEPRPIVWGRVRPISGNVMHSSEPRIIRREVKGQSSGGKGGKKKAPKQYEERVFRTYAIRICEGPITAIVRVWRNNKLVYDARGNDWGAENNGVFLKRATFYLGAWDQMPDPALESNWGAGEVPAYRGTCYMVVPDEDLTDLGGAIPQYTFEVERAEGTYLTSLPYAAECVEALNPQPGINEVLLSDIVVTLPTTLDAIGATPAVVELAFTEQTPRPIDYLEAVPAIESVFLSEPLVMGPEYMSTEPDVTLLQFSITYDRQAPEGLLGVPAIDEVSLI